MFGLKARALSRARQDVLDACDAAQRLRTACASRYDQALERKRHQGHTTRLGVISESDYGGFEVGNAGKRGETPAKDGNLVSFIHSRRGAISRSIPTASRRPSAGVKLQFMVKAGDIRES